MAKVDQHKSEGTSQRLMLSSNSGDGGERDTEIRTNASLKASEKPCGAPSEETRARTGISTSASSLAKPEPKGAFKRWITSINPGLPMMALNSLTACFISLTVKSLTSPPYSYGTMQLVFVRSLILAFIGLTWTCGWPFAKYYYRTTIRGKVNAPRPVIKDSLADLLFGPRNARLIMFARSLCGFVTVSGTYLALIGLNVGEATVLTFIKSIWVGIFGWIMLSEPWEKLDAICSLISLLGVGIIASPTSFGLGGKFGPAGSIKSVEPLVRILSLVAGIVSSLSAAAVYVFLRKMKGQNISAMQVSTTFAVWSSVLSFAGAMVMDGRFNCVAAFRRLPTSWWEFTLLVPLMSVMSLANQLLMNLALRHETAAKCSAMGFSQAPFGYISDWIAYGDLPGLPDYIGGGMVVGCVLLMTLQKLKKEMDAARHLAALKISAAAHLAAHKVVDLGSHMHLHVHMPHLFHLHHEHQASDEHSNLKNDPDHAIHPQTGEVGAPTHIKLSPSSRPEALGIQKKTVFISKAMVSSMGSLHMGPHSPLGSHDAVHTQSPHSCSSSDDERAADDQPLMMRPLVPKGGGNDLE